MHASEESLIVPDETVAKLIVVAERIAARPAIDSHGVIAITLHPRVHRWKVSPIRGAREIVRPLIAGAMILDEIAPREAEVITAAM